MPTFQTGAGALYYEEAGAGEPLLLIAGFGANTTAWRMLRPALEPHFRLIMLDNRGAGRSAVPPGPYTTAQMADDAAALLRRLGVAQARVLGNSMGGMIAQELALRHPARVGRLVLYATAACPTPLLQRLLEAQNRAIQSGMTPADRALWVLPWMHSPAWVARQAAGSADGPEPEDAWPASDTGLMAQSHAVIAHDTRARLPQITAPTLVLSAAEDILTPAAGGQELAAGIPHARFQLLPRGGHVADLEYPEDVGGALRAFLLG